MTVHATKPDLLAIALRAQDHHEGVKELSVDPIVEVEFNKTILIGKAAALAMHLRGLLYVNDYKALQYSAAQLGIRASDLDLVLRELEEIGFVRVLKENGKFKRLEINVPQLRTGYEELGQRWKDVKPTEIEAASVQILSTVVAMPQKERELLAKLGVDKKAYDITRDVLTSATLLDRYEIPGEEPILYSPLMVDQDPAPLMKLLKNHQEAEIAKAFEQVKQYEGLHQTHPSVANNPVVKEAVLSGILQPTAIDTAQGSTQEFLFTPHGGLQPEEGIVLDKARAIVACVRAGQHFSKGRAIFSPRKILGRLREFKRFKSGHPDLQIQYGTLVAKQIGFTEDEGGGKFNFNVYDTPENIKALDVAIDMLELKGETPTARLDIEAQRSLFDPSSYSGPIPTRSAVARRMKRSKTSQVWVVEKLTKLARGISDGE